MRLPLPLRTLIAVALSIFMLIGIGSIVASIVPGIEAWLVLGGIVGVIVLPTALVLWSYRVWPDAFGPREARPLSWFQISPTAGRWVFGAMLVIATVRFAVLIVKAIAGGS